MKKLFIVSILFSSTPLFSAPLERTPRTRFTSASLAFLRSIPEKAVAPLCSNTDLANTEPSEQQETSPLTFAQNYFADEDLLQDLHNKNYENARQNLECGANPNRGHGGLLVEMVRLENEAAVKLLLEYGADPSLMDSLALTMALHKEHDALAPALLEAGAKLDESHIIRLLQNPNKTLKTHALLALFVEKLDETYIIELLKNPKKTLKTQAFLALYCKRISSCFYNKLTKLLSTNLLVAAIRKRDAALIQFLLENNKELLEKKPEMLKHVFEEALPPIDETLEDLSKEDPSKIYYETTIGKNGEVITESKSALEKTLELLTDNYTQITIPWLETSTILHTAASIGNIEGLTILLEHGIDPNIQESRRPGGTALRNATCLEDISRRNKAIAILLKYGANLDAKDYRNRTPRGLLK